MAVHISFSIFTSLIEMADKFAFFSTVDGLSCGTVCELIASTQTYFRRGMFLSGRTDEWGVMIIIPPLYLYVTD